MFTWILLLAAAAAEDVSLATVPPAAPVPIVRQRSFAADVAAQSATGKVFLVKTAAPSGVAARGARKNPRVFEGNPNNYLKLLRKLKPGSTLVLAAGIYDNPSSVPGLPIFHLNGSIKAPIVIRGPESGPPAVLIGRSNYNTVRIADSSYVVVRNLEIDGRDLGGDGVKAQGTAHHITVENLLIRGVGDDQQTVGISTNGGTTWDWVIRHNTIIGAGTGMYLGNSDGNRPFVAGLIEDNLVRDTIGYNIEIKHQNPRPTIDGMPKSKRSTVIRYNVFSKSDNSSTRSLARPNLLVGHFPLSGVGINDVYEIYGNFFYQNPSEALFQGEGNIAFHHNLLVNDYGSAVHIQPHNDVPKMVRIFSNTIIARDTGISVTGGSGAFTQLVVGNAVFAGTPITAPDRRHNVTGTYASAADYLQKPHAVVGQIDLFPKPGALVGVPIDPSSFDMFIDWDVDFNGVAQERRQRGAYSGGGRNPGWKPKLEIRPVP